MTRARRGLVGLAAFGLLAASCDDSSSSQGEPRIDPLLVGTWGKVGATTPGDTLVFSSTVYRLPTCSGSGEDFWARDGVVRHGPDRAYCGEYAIARASTSGPSARDTLFYETLLGSLPDGVDTLNAPVFLKIR